MTCSGQMRMETFRSRKRESIKAAINWICANVQDDHDWVSELSLVTHENEILGELDHDIEVSCIVR